MFQKLAAFDVTEPTALNGSPKNERRANRAPDSSLMQTRLFGLFGYFFHRWFAHLFWPLGVPITPPGPAMILKGGLKEPKFKQNKKRPGCSPRLAALCPRAGSPAVKGACIKLATVRPPQLLPGGYPPCLCRKARNLRSRLWEKALSSPDAVR